VLPDIAEYAASKAAIEMTVKCMALKEAANGVRINGITPGPFNTDMLRDFAKLDEQQVEAAFSESTPAKRTGLAKEIGQAVEYLIGDQSSYCFGTQLVVDGGFSLA